MSVAASTNPRSALASSLSRGVNSYPTHPEAADWYARVLSNGGSASLATRTAVSNFCRAVDASSGLRAAILRANLICGDGLASCLVPLYRGASLTGPQLGNTTDTNTNFVAGDYAETGASGGLKGNGTTKFLNTGLTPNNIPSLNSLHLCCSATSMETTGDRCAIGSFNGSSQNTLFSIDIYANYVTARAFRAGQFGAGLFPLNTSVDSFESTVMGVRSTSSAAQLIRGGSLSASNTTAVTTTGTAFAWYVFAMNSNNTASTFSAMRCRMYSIGNGLTAQQASDLNAAVVAFNAALGRA